ncbi:MAG: hypothetical protein RIB52_12290 [Erythrobacter sp.]|uniref:hypothetical protein n=1 Tax=Erythrobacter sp. TaxID=1042 RepID=UPI0032EF83F1
MDVAWRDVAFQPGRALAAEITHRWRWLTDREDLQPFLCSKLGDVFATDAHGRVHWLCCPAGHIDAITADRAEFEAVISDDGSRRDEWFGPSLVTACHAAGKRASAGECYMFKTLPLFPDCAYEPANIAIVPLDEVFIELSEVLQLYAGLPERQKRRLHLFE